MIVGFSKHGKGCAQSAIDYFLARSGSEGDLRDPVPVILAGDPSLIARTAELSPHKWKYTSGVLSWAPGEEISEEIEQELIQSFEDYAFAGIDPENRPPMLWVRHRHAGHHEMHFVSPRILNDGRSYNMRPPGDERRWDSFRSYFNAREAWADPDDPGRARLISLPDWIEKSRKRGRGPPENIQEIITNWVRELVEDEIITNREDLINIFKEQGFDLARKSKNYISLKPPENGKNIRLKGIFYNERFNTEKILHEETRTRETNSSDLQRGKLKELRQGYDRAQCQREEHNRRRYGRKKKRNKKSLEDKSLERGNYKPGDLGDYINRHLELGGISDGQSLGGSKRSGDLSSPDVSSSNSGTSGKSLGASRIPATSTIQEHSGLLVTGREVSDERINASREAANTVHEGVTRHLRKSAERSRKANQVFEEIYRIRRRRHEDLKAANQEAFWLYERFIRKAKAIKDRVLKAMKSVRRFRGNER